MNLVLSDPRGKHDLPHGEATDNKASNAHNLPDQGNLGVNSLCINRCEITTNRKTRKQPYEGQGSDYY